MYSTTHNGHLTDDTADLMEHMFSYHDIYFPVSGEIIEYTSHKFASMISSATDYAALLDLRASIREPIPEEADKVCSICQGKFNGCPHNNIKFCNIIRS
ncbi:unnamed protein product [Brassica oleracea var. botrytis]|uniref:(rape) hypothetical protein n=1 Tax=Brassica napus TaxID=3708 RepID=A0A816JW84_BRANA|nr:unnamed protein product [Brassica napus]